LRERERRTLLRERARAEKEEGGADADEDEDEESYDEDDDDDSDGSNEDAGGLGGGDARQLREMASAGALLRQALKSASQKESVFTAGEMTRYCCIGCLVSHPWCSTRAPNPSSPPKCGGCWTFTVVGHGISSSGAVQTESPCSICQTSSPQSAFCEIAGQCWIIGTWR